MSTQRYTKEEVEFFLAKQQEEFVKCIPKEMPIRDFKPECLGERKDLNHTYSCGLGQFWGYNQCIADIKSKLNKEEPAYIGGVNLTTNDTEISSRLAVTDRNISMLRQWLNEDRKCDPCVTNEDIEYWLGLSTSK